MSSQDDESMAEACDGIASAIDRVAEGIFPSGRHGKGIDVECLVDAIGYAGSGLEKVATAMTMGGAIDGGLDNIASAIQSLADAVREVARR